MNKTENQNQMQVGIIHVPFSEWSETKNQIAQIAQMIKDNADRNSENLTPKEVCEMLKIGRATFDRLKNDGTLPVYRIGKAKRWYCKRSELLRLLNEGKLSNL